MGLRIIETGEGRLVSAPVLAAVRDALRAHGGAVLLVPSFAQALAAQRSLAEEDGLSLGVTVTTPEAWAAERWQVWGSGEREVSTTERLALLRLVMDAAAREGTLGSVVPTGGTLRAIARLVSSSLRAVPGVARAQELSAGAAGDDGGASATSGADPHAAAGVGAGMAGTGGASPTCDGPGAMPASLTAGERTVCDLAVRYAAELQRRSLVERCDTMARLPMLLRESGVPQLPIVACGFGTMPLAVRQMLAELSADALVTVAVQGTEGAAGALTARSVDDLLARARALGVPAACEHVAEQGIGTSAAAVTRPAAPQRAPELSALSAALFRAGASGVAAVRPTGAVWRALADGPLAEAELVAREVVALAKDGASEVVVCVPDVAAAWRTLAPKVAARGLAVRALVCRSALDVPAVRAFLGYARELARLSELDWPAPQESVAGPVPVLGDMDWWPPRPLTDFLLSTPSGVGHRRAWALDARWRGNRSLTPELVIAQLQKESLTSRAVARATASLLRGKVAAAVRALLEEAADGEPADSVDVAWTRAPVAESPASALVAGQADDQHRASSAERPLAAEGASDQRAAAAPAAPGPAPEPAPGPAGPEMPATRDVTDARGRRRATKLPTRDPWERDALRLVEEAARELEGLGVGAATDRRKRAVVRMPLSRLVQLLREALGRQQVGRGLALGPSDAACTVRLCTMEEAAALDAGSVDAAVVCGLTSAERSLAPDGSALATLLEKIGGDVPADPLERARLTFSAVVALPRTSLVLERATHDAQACETYPAAVLSELLACYGELVGMLPVVRRGEERMAENLSASGESASREVTVTLAPKERLTVDASPLVVVPREGQARLPGGLPSLSASQMETYLECPYKWFALKRLGLGEVDATFTNLQMGSFAHRVLEVTRRNLLHQALVAEGRASADETPSASPDQPVGFVAGSAVRDDTCALAHELLDAEFDYHLAHQRQKASVLAAQSLVPHTPSQEFRLRLLRRSLHSSLDYELGRLMGFAPAAFELRFGGTRAGANHVTYAGADFVGSIDRVDVDAHGRALVIDYKHMGPDRFSRVYDVYADAERPTDRASLTLPHRVQALIYAQVVRRMYPQLKVIGATYLSTRGDTADDHVIAGAIDANAVDHVLGSQYNERRAKCVSVGGPGELSFEELLDETEERIAEAIRRMRAGDVEVRPSYPGACAWCPAVECDHGVRRWG